MGPKGSGKRILFELITGCNVPTAGRVCCMGKNIHSVRYKERERLAIHYQQSDQVRDFRRTQPGFMLDFFYKLRREDRLVFVCVHPNERFHIDILKEICERFFLYKRVRCPKLETSKLCRITSRLVGISASWPGRRIYD